MNKLLSLFSIFFLYISYYLHAAGDEKRVFPINVQTNDNTTVEIPHDASLLSGTLSGIIDSFGGSDALIPLPLDKANLIVIGSLLKLTADFFKREHNKSAAEVFERKRELEWNKAHHEGLVKVLQDSQGNRDFDLKEIIPMLHAWEYLDCRWLMPVVAHYCVVQLQIENREKFANLLEHSRDHFADLHPDVVNSLYTQLAKFWYLHYGNFVGSLFRDLDYSFDLQELIDFDKINRNQRCEGCTHCCDLESYRISKLRPHYFDPFKSAVVNLFLNNNRLKEVSSECLNMPRLETLGLSDNHLETLQPNWNVHLTKLQYLELNRNRFQELNVGWSDGLNRLLKLHLSLNRLKSVHVGWDCSFANLMELDLSHNELEELPPACFSNLKKLEVLYLSFNKLKTLCFNVFCSPDRLKDLALNDNQLHSLQPADFGVFPQLKELRLSHNRFEGLPQCVLNILENLQRLWIDSNNLSDQAKQVIKETLPQAEIIC